jgi:hypothetical protein
MRLLGHRGIRQLNGLSPALSQNLEKETVSHKNPQPHQQHHQPPQTPQVLGINHTHHRPAVLLQATPQS